MTCDRVPVDDDAVHAAGDDHLEQRVVQHPGHRARVCEPVRVLRVQLLIQHDDRDLDSCQDELAGRRVVHRGYGGPLANLRWDVYVGLWKPDR